MVQILLRAGPQGLKVAQILDAACNMGLVPGHWANNRASRASQISNAMRNTKLFVHVGDHRYAISKFPGVQLIPLKPAPGSARLLACQHVVDDMLGLAPSAFKQCRSVDPNIACTMQCKSLRCALDSHISSMKSSAGSFPYGLL